MALAIIPLYYILYNASSYLKYLYKLVELFENASNYMIMFLKNTDLAAYYEEHPFDVFTLDSYVDLLLKCIENLSPEIVIHRLTGDGP